MANGLFNLKQVVQAVQQGGWPAQKTPAVEYLVVAGGGGTLSYGGGGGAGGLLQGIDPVPSGQTLLVTVGAGGSIGANNGSNSVFGAITATGGGFGSNGSSNGGSGGSGGGGGGLNDSTTTKGGQGTSGQGNAGGMHRADAGPSSGYIGAGGGGGAATVGLDGYSLTGGNGGAGITSAISGTVTAYAGGGGGSGYDAGGPVAAGVGGVGGGGNGGYGGAGSAGTANTGGGGGGGTPGGSGFAGGSGIVIVSYPDVYAAPTATTGSPTVSTSGSGSISFNGAGTQSVNYAGQTPFSLGTGDFTIECWVYFNSLSGTPFVIDFRNGAVSSASVIFISGANTLTYYDPGATVTIGTVATSTWYHVAVTRNGTSLRTFLNGTLANTASDSQNLSVGSDRPVIGGYGPDPSQSSLNGYVSNLRVIKGTAIYTASFTAPTAPLNAVSGTSLLLNTVSGAYLADGSTNSYVGVVRGTPSWNATSPFTVTGYKNRVYTWTSSGSITF